MLDARAARLLRVPIAGLLEEMRASLEELGTRLRVDWAGVFDLRAADRRLEPVAERARAGSAEPLPPLHRDALPWLVERVAAREPVTFSSCAALPRAAARERRWFARHGPRSAVFLPLVVGGSTAGVLAVGTMRRERRWGRAALERIDRAGVALAAALVRSRAHEESLETEGRLAGVLECGPGGILIARASGRIVEANGAASAIFLRTRDDLRGERLQGVLEACAPPRRSAREGLEALLRAAEPLQLEARRGDGTTVPVEVSLREVRTAHERLFCCGIRELSAERRARDEAARIRDEIAVRSRAATLAEMASGIAHELNQPLTAILSNAETAQRLLAPGGGDPELLHETLRDVVTETRRAADILGRIREMLRKRPVEHVPVDVGAVLESAVRRFREEAVARSIRLSLEIEPGLPPVRGDRVQLEQVATNLVLNAFEALGEGTPQPRTVAVRARLKAGGVDVSVRDSGPGLDAEAMARAFDAFFTTKPGGLGVGLPISRSIVEAHGGRLLARNNSDRGATLELHLPAAARGGAAAARREPA